MFLYNIMELEAAGVILTLSLSVASGACALAFVIYVTYYVFKDHRHAICRTLHV